ncbi:MAG: hypothetical protein M2R45_02240 [Verrucomicrobia subdivision 3 bacterium]|nr:hypothetical protein [Limisphaerales bacterium]MCS1413974.1 hypothetical protein [Limisphaerales bacterium]
MRYPVNPQICKPSFDDCMTVPVLNRLVLCAAPSCYPVQIAERAPDAIRPTDIDEHASAAASSGNIRMILRREEGAHIGFSSYPSQHRAFG